jgi:hypothetical protein
VSASTSYEPASPLVIVPCGARKRAEPARLPAGELYIGSYHLAGRRAAAALTTPDRILILSALHGLLPFDRVISPYELRMGQPGSIGTAALRRQAEQLHLVDELQVIVLAGRGGVAAGERARLRRASATAAAKVAGAAAASWERGRARITARHRAISRRAHQKAIIFCVRPVAGALAWILVEAGTQAGDHTGLDDALDEAYRGNPRP